MLYSPPYVVLFFSQTHDRETTDRRFHHRRGYYVDHREQDNEAAIFETRTGRWGGRRRQGGRLKGSTLLAVHCFRIEFAYGLLIGFLSFLSIVIKPPEPYCRARDPLVIFEMLMPNFSAISRCGMPLASNCISCHRSARELSSCGVRRSFSNASVSRSFFSAVIST